MHSFGIPLKKYPNRQNKNHYINSKKLDIPKKHLAVKTQNKYRRNPPPAPLIPRSRHSADPNKNKIPNFALYKSHCSREKTIAILTGSCKEKNEEV